MQNQVYKSVELTGSSSTTMEEAVQNAVARAAATIRQMSWFEVVETRGTIENGKVSAWQVTVKVGFALEDA
ncbi:MAG TPA: dodecin family protein [Caldilinea sp.]|nr:dodecin domain-containing protein [Anaerolineales bacterium]HRA66164.1 dodecin family protein [Caldilinea sp.]